MDLREIKEIENITFDDKGGKFWVVFTDIDGNNVSVLMSNQQLFDKIIEPHKKRCLNGGDLRLIG